MNTKSVILGSLLILLSVQALSQIRFYAQFRQVPFSDGSTNNFTVLTGAKIDPNKEIVLGWGMTGSFRPRQLAGDLRFNKSAFNLSFNFYQTRKLYYNFEVNLNLLKGIVSDLDPDNILIGTSKNLLKRAFMDYEVIITYVVLRRLHFSFGSGIVNLAQLVKDTTQDFLVGKIQLNVSLALKVYMFQIKY